MSHNVTIRAIPKRGGFSLIEMAIVLVIMSLLLGATLTYLTARTEQSRIETTKQRMQTIKEALITFVDKYHRLPCPAIPTVPTDANYGREALTPGTCAGTTLFGTSAKGIVPWVSLGLPAEVAIDAYFSQISYAVTLAATNLTQDTISGMSGSFSLHNATPILPGLPPAGNQTNTCNLTTTNGTNACNMMAVVMLVSHGKNGFGAFVPDLTLIKALPPGASAAEIENANNNERFVLIPYSDSDVLANRFDDFLLPLTPSDLLSPLERNGVQPSATAITKRSADSYLEQAIATAIVTKTVPIPAQLTAPNDGWNRPMTPLISVTALSLCDPLAVNATVTITSTGLDRFGGVNSDTGRNDDLVFQKSFSEATSKVTCP